MSEVGVLRPPSYSRKFGKHIAAIRRAVEMEKSTGKLFFVCGTCRNCFPFVTEQRRLEHLAGCVRSRGVQ